MRVTGGCSSNWFTDRFRFRTLSFEIISNEHLVFTFSCADWNLILPIFAPPLSFPSVWKSLVIFLNNADTTVVLLIYSSRIVYSSTNFWLNWTSKVDIVSDSWKFFYIKTSSFSFPCNASLHLCLATIFFDTERQVLLIW